MIITHIRVYLKRLYLQKVVALPVKIYAVVNCNHSRLAVAEVRKLPEVFTSMFRVKLQLVAVYDVTEDLTINAT
jgi:hypothetical protein